MKQQIKGFIGYCPKMDKRMYVTKTGAKHGRVNKQQRPYKCPHCDYWHLGKHYGKPRQWHRKKGETT